MTTSRQGYPCTPVTFVYRPCGAHHSVLFPRVEKVLSDMGINPDGKLPYGPRVLRRNLNRRQCVVAFTSETQLRSFKRRLRKVCRQVDFSWTNLFAST